jgi:succinate dehydrogenase/fumarate reductase flavoprotein subunit
MSDTLKEIEEREQAEERDRRAKAEQRERRRLAQLTPEALIEDMIALQGVLAEAKAKLGRNATEIKRLNDLVKSFDGDHAEQIRRLAKDVEYQRGKCFRANEEAIRRLNHIYHLKKQIKKLEDVGIPI